MGRRQKVARTHPLDDVLAKIRTVRRPAPVHTRCRDCGFPVRYARLVGRTGPLCFDCAVTRAFGVDYVLVRGDGAIDPTHLPD